MNIDVSPEYLTYLLATLRQYLPGTQVWAFGSRVKFTAKPASDLDLVAFVPENQKTKLSLLKETLADSNLPFKVDLHDWNDLPEAFRKNIEGGYVVIQEAKKEKAPKGWKTFRLGDEAVKIGSGATPRGGKEAYIDFGEISLIRSQNVLDFSFSKNGLVYITEEQAYDLRNVIVEEGDILLNITGDSVARVCQVPLEILPARVNQHVAIIRAKREKINQAFLKYYLLEPSFKRHMLGLASAGATRNALTKVMIENFEIKAPEDVTTQSQIAQILSSLDDKIELNLQMNRTLEDMAQAIFKEWFKGNKTVKLSDYIQINPSITIKKGSIIKYVEMADLPQVGFSIKSYIERPFTAGSKFKNFDTLLARITPCLENGKTGFVDFLNRDEYAFGSTEFIVMRPKINISPFFVYFLARDDKFRSFAIKSMVGTSGRQRVQTDSLNTFEIPFTNLERMKTFHGIVNLYFDKIKSNSDQNKTLTQFRDHLISSLMSGKITIGL